MASAAKPRLLVVDDEASLLLSYKVILERKGYSVTTAATSQEAEKLLVGNDFDLLVCDLNLERQRSGLAVIERARQRCPELGCVLLTGYPDVELSRQVQKEGVQTLFKPVEVPKLLETLDFVLRRQRRGEADQPRD